MFIIAFIQNSQKVLTTQCPIDEWINKVCYMPTMEHYSAIKGNEVLIYATSWRNLEYIMLSERSQ